jgi:hypothetical protein
MLRRRCVFVIEMEDKGEVGMRRSKVLTFYRVGRPPLNERVDVLQVKDQCSPKIYMQPWLALWIMSHKGRSYT